MINPVVNSFPVFAQTYRGRMVDLLNPKVMDIDFRGIAETLAHINRYNGASQSPISVAHHTLICFDAAPVELRPWVLLHDAHEAFIGDITEPVAAALNRLVYGLENELERLKLRHDKVIYEAAGLPLPNEFQRIEIRKCDLIAQRTEVRDFLPIGWLELKKIQPLKKVYRWRPIHDVADDLYARFQEYLPGLK